ncbi:relaxase/mobilization nuclease domain-containing protein [Ectopseudomonas khazarica]|uniref:relaxase/mobilization nuclease domain-containing protein n=1 Tax=Ectopseudomonas khazarica TaxID=2502979 RepID=UPI0037C66F2C
MISKIMVFAATFRERIEYEFAARKKDKEKINYVEFLGGNLVSGDPYVRVTANGESKVFVDVEPIIAEFESSAAAYKGSKEKVCGHYVLSLKKGESLSKEEWLTAVHEYMKELGYDETTKYVAVIHRDKAEEHVHIVTSRVRVVERSMSENRPELGANFQLVPTSNDYRKGMNVARSIEAEHGLSTPKSDGWSKETKPGFDPEKDQARIIRGIAKDIFKNQRPRTMSDLVNTFASRGIQIKVTENSSGEIQGIKYKLDREDGRWLAGSKVMDKLSWPGLQQQMRVSYIPGRDDYKLGRGLEISNPDVTAVKNDGALFRAYVKIKPPREELYHYVRSRRQRLGFHKDNGVYFIGFNVGINLDFRKLKRHEVEAEKQRWLLEALLASCMSIAKNICQTFFSECSFHFDYEADISEYKATALRLNIPVIAGVGDEFVLEDGAAQKIQDQVKKHLGGLASACIRNEYSDSPSISL